MILETTEPLPISTVVSVEHEDVLFLGEVLSCRVTSGPAWNVEIKVAHFLTGLQNLMALRKGLLGEGVPSQTFHSIPPGVFN
ncbi:MAG: hypothetical protein JO097_09110 [Acidobacteriaceae bacterium]|nr:hypothetical protein [Acidobacteriaceae bacterium]MBV9294504.1 hypothetical protein [Acidobacteriaceae bacterium]MBV9766405.1 hypothetical protein [Acidobacteriaceae bacterium]